jgi:cell division protein FtsW (lipid II flippase)
MTRRGRELALLLLAVVAAAVAYATVFIAQSRVLDPTSLVWGGAFLIIALGVHTATRRFTPQADPFLVPATALLSGLGITMVTRLKPELASRQTIWLVLAACMLVALLKLLPHHRVLEHYKFVIGAGAVLALLITISPLGYEVNGAQLWLNLGLFQIQPGEFAKLGMVIFLAAYLYDTRELLGMGLSMKHLGPLLAFWGAAIALLVLMNDFGTSLLFYGSFLMMLYVATGRAWYVAVGTTAFAAASAAVYMAAAHVRQRFDVWLDPWKDPQGTGYQLIQGLFAMADGGLGGRGLGQAYLVTESGNTLIPYAHTDFVFAALADETGFLGAVGVLLLYVVITWRGFAIASRSRDGFSKLLAFGLSTVFALQVIVIVGGVVRLLPLTGQTLPFMSYGGSSVLANFMLIGLLLIISHHTNLERDQHHSTDGAMATSGHAPRARRRKART